MGRDLGVYSKRMQRILFIYCVTENFLREPPIHYIIPYGTGRESLKSLVLLTWPEYIYNPITAMGFSAMFTFQLDNTKR